MILGHGPTKTTKTKTNTSPLTIALFIPAQLIWGTLYLTRALILAMGCLWLIFAFHITLGTVIMGTLTLDLGDALAWYWDTFVYWHWKLIHWWIADLASIFPGVA